MGFFEDLNNYIARLAESNPLLAVFLASLVGNLVPFVPYLIVVVFVATTYQELSIVQLATVGALGAAIGKFAIYGAGYGAGAALSRRPVAARFNSLRRLLGGSAFLAGFIFAASPFPDDIVFIPLGIMRYSPPKTFIALFSGKFVLTLIVAYLARSSRAYLDILLGGSPIATAASVVVVLLIAIVMMRVDWEKFLERRQNGRMRRLLKKMKTLIRPEGKPEKRAEEGPSKVGSQP